MTLSSGIVFLEEGKHPRVVLERHLVSFGKLRQGRNVRPSSRKRTKDVFGEGDTGELEVGFEEEIGGVVKRQFAREKSFGTVEMVLTFSLMFILLR